MRKVRILPPLFLFVLLFSSCSLFVAKPEPGLQQIGEIDGSGITAEATRVTVQTGYPSGEIQRPQVMFRGNIYVYSGEGRDLPLPTGFAKVGTVEAIDNDPLTFSGEFTGSRVTVGQEIFASSAHIDRIYLAYEEGYARFTIVSNVGSSACPIDPQTDPSIWAVGYNALCVRFFPEFHPSGVGVAPIVVVDSAEALADYVSALGSIVDLDSSAAADLQAALAHYQGEHNAFFETHFLLIAQIREPSGSIRHEPMELLLDDNTATLWVRRLVPEVGTCDMADWTMFAEVARDDLDPQAIAYAQIAFDETEMVQTEYPGHTGCEG